jgi:hypothetical protein
VADLFDKEVVLAVAGTAALMSERARRAIRRGAVYTIAGAITAGEAVASAAKSVGRDGERETANGRRGSERVERPSSTARAKSTS